MTDEPFTATITASRLITGMSRNSRAKWLFVAAIGALNLVWMKTAGFHFGHGFFTCAGAAGVLVAIALFYFYSQRDDRIRDYAHFAAQFVALSLVMIPLEYLAVSTNAPLADAYFAALDEAMGLDWPAWARWVAVHPVIDCVLGTAYVSIWPQIILTFAYNVHARASERNSELWWITVFASFATVAVASLLPAVSAWVYHGFAQMNDFVHMQQFAGLRVGTIRTFDLANTQGLIQLPSFHTVLAIMVVYNFRHHRWLLPICLGLDGLVIIACPTHGGHYFIDLPAGAIVAALAIAAVRAWERRLNALRPRLVLAPAD
jgi:hypothetical protein